MSIEEWRKAYIERLVSRGVDQKLAEETFAGMSPDDYDLDDCPEQAADDELSYWDDDEANS